VTIRIEIEIEGANELRQVFNIAPRVASEEFGKAFHVLTQAIATDAKRLAPVDTGRLRSSINGQVRFAGTQIVGEVGTKVFYAPYMEFGTGKAGDPAVPHKGSHWPPGKALGTWARRHGFKSGYQVAAIIGKRGGLRPRKYFRPALEKNKARVDAELQTALNRVLRRLSK
jgi:HK97 gp10 family phage protein